MASDSEQHYYKSIRPPRKLVACGECGCEVSVVVKSNSGRKCRKCARCNCVWSPCPSRDQIDAMCALLHKHRPPHLYARQKAEPFACRLSLPKECDC